MSNHVHLIWQTDDAFKPAEVQQSFMKYTAQMILKELRNNHPEVLKHFKVDAKDRTYQIWERNPLSVSLFNRAVFLQKLNYMHKILSVPDCVYCRKYINIHPHLFIIMKTNNRIF